MEVEEKNMMRAILEDVEVLKGKVEEDTWKTRCDHTTMRFT